MKRNLLIIPFALSALALASCGGGKLKGFEKLNSVVKESEKSFIKYNERAEIIDSKIEVPVYAKLTDFEVTRGKSIWTEVDIKELRLPEDGSSQDYELEATNRHFKTYGEKVIETIDGRDFESTKPVPTYFLTFNPNETFFSEGYTLTEEGSNMSLKANIKDENVSQFFLNKAFGEVKNVNVSIDIKDDKLASFKTEYQTKNGNIGRINTTYTYPVEVEAENDYVNAVFHLEGGTSGDIKSDLTLSYNFNGRYEMHIIDPNKLKEDNITMPGYHIEGWYKTKKEVNGEVVYEDKFDFDHDTMGREGIHLYANWQKDITYTYGVYYKDSKGLEHKLGEYKVKAGDSFQDHRKLANKVSEFGLTSLGYLDSEGKPWNNRFTHPGGKDDLEIKVYLDTIEGVYKIVNTFNDFKASKLKNMYINKDIDCGNKDLSFKEYKGKILGNDHKIYNLRVQYNGGQSGLEQEIGNSASSKSFLYVSLFRKLSGVTIENIEFENITIDMKTIFSKITNIIITPFATEMTDTTLDNVRFSGMINVISVPKQAIVVINNEMFAHTKTNSVIKDNCKIDVKVNHVNK